MFKDNGTTAFDSLNNLEKFHIRKPWDIHAVTLTDAPVMLTTCTTETGHLTNLLETDTEGEYTLAYGFPIATNRIPIIAIKHDIITRIDHLKQFTGSLNFWAGVVLTESYEEKTYDLSYKTGKQAKILEPDHKIANNGSNGNWIPDIYYLNRVAVPIDSDVTLQGEQFIALSDLAHAKYIIPCYGVTALLSDVDNDWSIQIEGATAHWELKDAYNPVYTRPYRTVGY